MCAMTLPAWMIATTAAGAPAGGIARPLAPIVAAAGEGGAICPVGWLAWAGVVPGAVVAVVAAAVVLDRGQHAVDPQACRALEHPHARPRRRAERAVTRSGEAELRQIVLQEAHVRALRTDAEAADAEPAPIAGTAALRPLERLQEPLGHACRAVETDVRAQRAHHRRGVRAELPVRLHRIAQAREHPLQLLDGRALLTGVQPGQCRERGSPRGTSGLGRRSRDADGEYRCEKEKNRLRRTMWGVNGSRHGFRGQSVSKDAGAGRARWRRMRAAACSVRTDPTGSFFACRG
jgi:hypothetical protein